MLHGTLSFFCKFALLIEFIKSAQSCMETTYRPEAQCPLVNVHNKQYIYLYRSIHTNIQKYKAHTENQF